MKPNKTKLFGTDGIRGTANCEPMSVDTILRVGRAAACVFRREDNGRHSVLIGKDTRLSGYMFETALASGLCSMGVDVFLVGPITTPGVAHLTATMRVDAGVIISASHNPYEDNGVKFFGPDGFKLSDEIEDAIEALVSSERDLDHQRPASAEIGKAKRLEDARGRYISYLKHVFPRDLSLSGVRMVLDCANGGAYKIAPLVFSELGASLCLMGVRPNGRNINRNCGAVNTDALVAKVKETEADIGIALDGDADRVVFCDENGSIFDGDGVLALLAEAFKENGGLGSGLVGTVMSNFGLERFCEKSKIAFYRTQVGDRYVVEKMRATHALLGGEPSGHIVSLRDSTTGDGVLTALLVLAQLILKDRPLSEFQSFIERFPQVMKNVIVKEKKDLSKIPSVSKSITSAEGKLNGTGRILVRYSGTEPKARVMVEGEDGDLVQRLADEIAATIQKEIGVR